MICPRLYTTLPILHISNAVTKCTNWSLAPDNINCFLLSFYGDLIFLLDQSLGCYDCSLIPVCFTLYVDIDVCISIGTYLYWSRSYLLVGSFMQGLILFMLYLWHHFAVIRTHKWLVSYILFVIFTRWFSIFFISCCLYHILICRMYHAPCFVIYLLLTYCDYE